MGPNERRDPDYAQDRREAAVTTDPVQEHVETRREVLQGSREPVPTPRARVAGWPWAVGVLVVLALVAWLVYAVRFA